MHDNLLGSAKQRILGIVNLRFDLSWEWCACLMVSAVHVCICWSYALCYHQLPLEVLC